MKTYESYVNKFIGIEKLTEDKFSSLFNDNCQGFNFDDKAIYRGIDLPGEYYLVNPSKRTRKSRSTQNYYTLIMSNSDDWKDIPPRNKSIICSFDKKFANAYGNDNVFRVIPFNNSIWGASKVWIKEFNKLFNLMNFNNELDYFSNVIKISFDDDNYDILMQQLNNMSDKFLNYNFDSEVIDVNSLSIIKNLMIKDNLTLDKAILKILKPNDNIISGTYNEIIETQGVELWTSSICLLKKINI